MIRRGRPGAEHQRGSSAASSNVADAGQKAPPARVTSGLGDLGGLPQELLTEQILPAAMAEDANLLRSLGQTSRSARTFSLEYAASLLRQHVQRRLQNADRSLAGLPPLPDFDESLVQQAERFLPKHQYLERQWDQWSAAEQAGGALDTRGAVYALRRALIEDAEHLELDNYSFSRPPPGIERLRHLQSLSLRGNRLAELPAEVLKCKHLKRLQLQNNFLQSLPENIDQLQSLQVLDCSNNAIASLPLALMRLTRLQIVNFAHNLLAEVPACLMQLPAVTDLTLAHNRLESLPPQAGTWTGLDSLHLNHNQLATIPDWMGSLMFLNTLSLHHNRLIDLPQEMGALVELTFLSLDHNRFWQIPACIAGMFQLEMLNLSHNAIATVPRRWRERFLQLTQLVRLDLRHNSVQGETRSLQHLLPPGVDLILD